MMPVEIVIDAIDRGIVKQELFNRVSVHFFAALSSSQINNLTLNARTHVNRIMVSDSWSSLGDAHCQQII